ncbi:MAG: serine/threonine-protein kinase [Polyangiales bacterium]
MLPSTSPTIHSLPRDTEEGRALLQERLARYGRGWLYIAAFFLVVVPITGALVQLPDWFQVTVSLVGSVLVTGTLSQLQRFGPLSVRALIAIDLGFAWLNTGIFVAYGLGMPLWARPEVVQLLIVTYLLAARAFVVPSTWRRTAVAGLAPVLAIIIGTYFLYKDGRPHVESPPMLAYVQVAIVLGIVTIVITSWTSNTIWGLRERAREAMQLGQYTLLEKIGAGGMGVVYKARHATLRRPTAIKLLPAARAGVQNLTRFEREVQLTSQLTHPNTIAIYDYGRSADGILYYAMEYLDGLDLESIVSLAGPLPEARVAHVLRQVCAALSEAHGAGLMHRDIKPQNILLCTRGGVHDVAKVLDFGLVKDLASPATASLSQASTIIGTPLYMSPEAIVRPSELDARGDLYALGAVGYYLLTGTPPFRATNVVEICSMHLHAQPEPPSKRLGRAIDPSLEAILLRCLEKKPEDRFPSAKELGRALDLPLPWSAEQGETWWSDHREQVEHHKTQRGQETDSSPIANTVAVDLRERQQPFEPWHSGEG